MNKNKTQETAAAAPEAPRSDYNLAVKNACDFNDMKAQRDELLAALKDAANWLSRSTRIDDQEQAQDAQAAIAKAERGR